MLSTLAPPTHLQKSSDPTTSAPCRRRYYRSPGGPRTPSPPPVTGRYTRSWRPASAPPNRTSHHRWSGRTNWLNQLEAALRSPTGEQTRRDATRVIKVETALDVAHADAAAADSRTGQHVATAHATVARLLGCSEKTVQTARLLIERLGFAVTVTPGRYLTSQERADAHVAHGGDQRRMASERALVTPLSSKNVHLPSGCSVSTPVQLRSNSPSPALTRSAGKRRSNKDVRRPSLAVQRLAAALVHRMPWLGRQHIGHLCRVLARHGVDDQGWTAADVLSHIDAYDARHGHHGVAIDVQRNPLGLFAAQLSRAVGVVDLAPIARRQQEQHIRAAERRAVEQRRQQAQADRDARQQDPARRARHEQLIAKTRAQIAAARASQVRRG